jgi:hypothetical protein
MFGNRALYNNGWVAGCLHGRLPWETVGGASFDEDAWELYNIEKDFSQANDLAKSEPKKLRELQDRFVAEVAKYNVLPLDDRFAQRADPTIRPSYIRGKTRFVYPAGTVRVGERSSPQIHNVHHTIEAEIEIPQSGAEGVIVCCGGVGGGYTVFLKDGKLHWEHNYYNEVHYRVSSTELIPPGKYLLSVEVQVDKQGKMGTGGTTTLRLGEKKIGEGRFDKQCPSTSQQTRPLTSAATAAPRFPINMRRVPVHGHDRAGCGRRHRGLVRGPGGAIQGARAHRDGDAIGWAAETTTFPREVAEMALANAIVRFRRSRADRRPGRARPRPRSSARAST